MSSTNYMKDMTFRKKIDHIWDYYRIHIIVGVLFVAFVGFMIASQLSKVEYVVNLTFTDNVLAQTNTEELEKKATTAVLPATNKGRVRIEVLPINNQSMQAYLQKFVAELSVGEIDVLVMAKEDFQKYMKSGAFQPIDQVKGLNVSGWTGFVEGTVADKKDKANYGISLEGANGTRLRSLGIITDNQVLCIANSMKNTEHTIGLVNWIMSR